MDTANILTMKINFENLDLMAPFAWRVTYDFQFFIHNNKTVSQYLDSTFLKSLSPMGV